MPKSPLRKSVSGEVDSEVIRLGDKDFLFTTDDFSAEDLLQENDPYILGWNICCGAISDIVAAGGKPLVYSHSMIIPSSWDEKFVIEFSKGISAVLRRYSVSFIGGDIGVSSSWRYTASVIGVHVGKPVNRKGCKAGDAIFITGGVGSGNLEAAMCMFKANEYIKKLPMKSTHKFRAHEQIPEIIAKYASCAIDTSDGALASLQTISHVNSTGFQIDKIRYNPAVQKVAQALHIPELLFFMGECGEYEILFTVNQINKESLKNELKVRKISSYELGIVTESPMKVITHKKHIYDFSGYNLRARDYKNTQDYLVAMIEWVGTKDKSR